MNTGVCISLRLLFLFLQECVCIRLRDWEEGNYRISDLDDPAIGMRRGEILVGGPTVCAGYLESAAIPDPEVSYEIIRSRSRRSRGSSSGVKPEILVGGPTVCAGYLPIRRCVSYV